MEYYRLTIPIPKRPWLWLRFRITTVLLTTAILCLLLAWRRDHLQLSAQLHQLQYPGPNWDTAQATGPPNTPAPGDRATAWASLTADGQSEWLILEFEASVVPKAILVHENFSPGAVVKASHYPRFGREQTLWEGTDPTPVGAGSGVSRLPVTNNTATGRIKLYIDSQNVPGWNEIDAVGLVYGDNDDQVIWAKSATASSSFGNQGNGEFQSFQSTRLQTVF
jgi:hypothetical protein